MKVESRKVFVSDDGKVFDTEAECLAHEQAERDKAKALEKLVVREITHGFDGTEGRGYFRTTYLVTDATEAEILQFCFTNFGNPLSEWIGGRYYEAWRLSPLDPDLSIQEVQGRLSGRKISPHHKSKMVVYSQNDFQFAGLEKSVPVWPQMKLK